MLDYSGAELPGVPYTREQLAELEASYRPFQSLDGWRGVHVDVHRWDRYAHNLARRVQAAGDEQWAEAQGRLLRAAAFDSGALDGLFPANPEWTTTVLASSIGASDRPGEASDAVEVLAECHRRALVLAGEAAIEGRAADVDFIALLLDVITEAQATYTVTTPQGDIVEVDLPRRRYKPVSNYLREPEGGLVAFAPAGRVAAEMDRLAAELASAQFSRVHPVVQAAYAHYALTAIHPFADGNGRLARTVASIYLMRAVGVPLLVFADQWPAYFQAVGAAQAGDAQSLANHVCAVAINTMDFAAHLLAPRSWSYPRAVRRRRPPFREAVDEGARRLLEALLAELRQTLVSPPKGVRIAIAETTAAPADHVEGAYRVVADADTGRVAVRVSVRADSPAEPVGVDLEFVALSSEAPYDLLPVALRETRSKELLEAALDDTYPLVLEAAALRVRLWAQRLLAEALAPVLATLPRPAGARRRQSHR